MTIQEALDKIKQNKAAAEQIRQEGKAAGTWGKQQNSTLAYTPPKVVVPEEKKTSADKMWDRRSEPEKMSETTRAKQEKDKAKKEYDKYVSSDEYRKKQVESVRDQQRAMDQDESRSFDSTSDFGAFPAAQDAMEARLRQEKERAESEFNAREDRETFEKGMAEIDAMSEEDLVLLDEYVRNRDNRQDVFVNNISWRLSNKKEGDALKALAEKYGEDKALQLAEIYGMDLHEKNAADAASQGREGVNDGWISATAHNLLGIPARAMGNISGFMGRMSAEANRTGQFHGLPVYTAGDELSAYGGAVTEQTAQNIEGDVYDEEGNLIKDGGVLRDVASWGYQGAMSIADSTARLAMSGGNSAIASAVASMGTFNQSMQKYSAMGASPEQAYAAATMSAGIEYITEKLPMDEALDLLHCGGDTGVVKKVLTQAFLVEPSSEELNLFANMAMEAKVLGEKSGKEQRIGDLIAGGLTRDQAEQQFWKETWMEALETYAVSAFAGLFGAGGAAITGNLMQAAQEQQQMYADPAVQGRNPTDPSVQNDTTAQQKRDNTQRMQEYEVDRKTRPETIEKIITGRWYREMSNDYGFADFSESDVQAVLADPEAVAWMQARGLDPADAASLDAIDLERYQLPGTVAADTAAQPDAAAQAPTEADLVRMAMDSTGAGLPETAPAPAPAAPMNDQQENLQMAMDDLMGGQEQDTAQDPRVNEIQEMDAEREISKQRQQQEAAQLSSFPVRDQQNGPKPKKDIYFHFQELSPQSSFFDDKSNMNEGPDQVHFTLMNDNSVDLDLSAYSNGINAANAITATFDPLYDFTLDGTPIDPNDPTLQYTYVTFEDVRRPIVRQISGGNYMPYTKGTINLYSDMREVPSKKVNNQQVLQKPQAENLPVEPAAPAPTEADLVRMAMDSTGAGLPETAPAPAPTAPMNDQQENLQMAMDDLMGGQEQQVLMELADSTRGERTYNEDVHYESGGEQGWSGVKQISTYDNEPTATVDTPEAVGDNLTATASSPQTENSENVSSIDRHNTDVTVDEVVDRQLSEAEPSQKSGPDFRNSNTYMNTGLQSENANIRAGYQQELRENPDAAKYEVKHNADTLAEAQRRTGSPENNAAALEDLLNKDHWTPEDVATSTLLLDEIMASGDKAAIAQLNALRQKRKEAGTYSGQVAQSFSIKNPTMKAADSPATAVDTFRSNLDGLKQEETTWNKKSGVDFETWKNQIKDDVDRIGIAIATVEDGDSDSMRQIIRQIAQRRGTTARFGTSQNLTGNAWSVLKKLDFQDLKKVANTQLVAMADDYRARGAGEVAKGLRKQNMLSSLKTFVRNISGNAVGSFADSVSESGAGRIADAVLSQFTGKKTMGSDILRAGTYAKAAKEAGQFASLCVELNIPIETDVDSSYSAAAGNSGNTKYLGKTFRATGNPAMRALYAYQKYMSYALEVTDKIFEGGTNAAVAESLNRLQGANLTEEEVGALADFTGNRRTFKNATWEEDGQTKGSELARGASKIQGDLGIVGEIAMPFVSTPMNVTQTGIDYTAGVVKGLGEMVSIIKDVKAGKTIPVERQRQAASDFGRGVTGTAMIAMFASATAMGALKVSNDKDWDKEALAQAEGRSGAQINWSALQRGLNGEDAKWQSGDIISGMDFLEPFNTQMYLGAELSQADDFNLLTGAGATIKSVWQSLMDSPVMTGLADIEQTLNDISEAETTEDAVNVAAGYAGDVASSYVPQVVRQIAQNQDGYYRDTRGENALDSAINSFMAAIPGQSEKLPVKYSGLGEAQQRGSAVETFLDPTATKEFQQNEVTTFLDELSGKVGEKANNIYPDRQAPMKFTYGDDWEVTLDGKMREDYQKTYGEKVNQLYTSLIRDKDFQGFSDELKIKALEEAKGYATRYAKAAVSDYREAPIGTVEALAKGIVQREVKSQMDAFFTDLDTQREYGYSTEETAAKLEESYQAFTGLSKDTQKEILEQATSDTAKYLEVRQKGVSTEQFLTATETLDGLKPQTGYKAVRDIQKWEAISKQPGLSDSGKDALMLAYMQDYDPTDKSPVKTELKYEYARQELGLTPREYVEVYNVSTSGKKNQKLATWRDMGYSREEANMFYRLFSATGKTKIDVVDWYNG